MEIRLLEEKDYEDFEKIMEDVQEMHVRWNPKSYKHMDIVISKELLKTIVNEKSFYVGIVNNEIIGIISYMIKHVDNPTHHKSEILFIDTLAIKEEYRHKGYGKKLLNFMEDLAVSLNCDKMMLQVNACNENAIKMYHNYGFTDTSINMTIDL